MLAIIAAVIFGLSLLFDLAEVTVGDAFDAQTLLFAGLLCLALHLAGVGTAARWRQRARR
jgi:hypothetical protein